MRPLPLHAPPTYHSTFFPSTQYPPDSPLTSPSASKTGVSAPSSGVLTPLHLGIPWTTKTFVDALLKHKPDLNLQNDQGISPFELLIRETGNIALCEYIRKFLQSGVDISRPSSRGHSLFHSFLANPMWEKFVGYYFAREIICDFLKQGADPSTVHPSGEPIIRHIPKEDSNFSFQDTIDLLPVMKGVSTVWDDGNTIAHDLCLACAHRDVRDVRKRDIQSLADTILGVNANPDVRNKRGQTPLLLLSTPEYSSNAVSNITVALLEAGSDPFSQDHFGKVPVLEAAKWTQPKQLQTFLEADLQLRGRTRGSSPQYATGTHEFEPVRQRLYWEDWELAAQAMDWGAARRIAFNPISLLATDLDAKVRKSALAALAKKHVRLVASVVAKEEVSPYQRENLRKLLGRILRDYRTTGLEIPVAWVDMILELS